MRLEINNFLVKLSKISKVLNKLNFKYVINVIEFMKNNNLIFYLFFNNIIAEN